MDNQKKCTVCKAMFDGESAAVLTMSGFGNARYICPECEALMDTATLGEDYGQIKEAIEALGERAKIDVADSVAFDTFAEILNEAAERAEKIKNGEYDFSLDAPADEQGFEEIPEELLESEEDRALDEKEAKTSAVVDKITSWICGGIIAAIVIFFIIRLIF